MCRIPAGASILFASNGKRFFPLPKIACGCSFMNIWPFCTFANHPEQLGPCICAFGNGFTSSVSVRLHPFLVLSSLLLWKRREVVLELQWFREQRDLWFRWPPLPAINPVRTKVNPPPRHGKCHPQPLLAVVYGDGWRQRSTLAFRAKSRFHLRPQLVKQVALLGLVLNCAPSNTVQPASNCVRSDLQGQRGHVLVSIDLEGSDV